jgi:hypothetical protein
MQHIGLPPTAQRASVRTVAGKPGLVPELAAVTWLKLQVGVRCETLAPLREVAVRWVR